MGYFEANPGEFITLSGIEQLAGELQVPVADVLTVLQILAADDIGVLERAYIKSESSEGAGRDVAAGELRSGLASFYARGDLANQGEQFVANVIVGWKPAGCGPSSDGAPEARA